MKPFKYKNKLYRYFYVRISRLFKTDLRSRYPKDVSDYEKTVSDIFISILHKDDTKLYYDTKTQECSLKNEQQVIWIFLERENIKIINSTYGYDRHISSNLEYYLADRFRQENTKRRTIMKEEALSRIEHSLSITLKKVNN